MKRLQEVKNRQGLIAITAVLGALAMVAPQVRAQEVVFSGRLADIACRAEQDAVIIHAELRGSESATCTVPESARLRIVDTILAAGSLFRAAPRDPWIDFTEARYQEPRTGVELPNGMPSVRFPEGFEGCSSADRRSIEEAWAIAHLYVYRIDQVMDWLADFENWRESAWSLGYELDLSRRSPGCNTTNCNYVPRAWFGPYDDTRFDIVDDGIEKVWSRFRDKTFVVKCRREDDGAHPCYHNNPQTGNRPSANTFVFGTINFCDRFFGRDAENRARGVVHEVFHHLLLNNGAWITDLHTHCDDGHCVTEPMYGPDKATHLAYFPGVDEGHFKRATRNTDNYAYFAFRLGRRVHEGRLTRFPGEGFPF